MELLDDLRAHIESRAHQGGGWASTSAAQRPVMETTCLALLAIAGQESSAWNRALHLMTNLQNFDGSWPAFEGDDGEGCWVTSLAVITLAQMSPSTTGIQKA